MTRFISVWDAHGVIRDINPDHIVQVAIGLGAEVGSDTICNLRVTSGTNIELTRKHWDKFKKLALQETFLQPDMKTY